MRGFNLPKSPLSALKQKLKREDSKSTSLISVSRKSNRRIDRSTTRKKLV